MLHPSTEPHTVVPLKIKRCQCVLTGIKYFRPYLQAGWFLSPLRETAGTLAALWDHILVQGSCTLVVGSEEEGVMVLARVVGAV